MRTLALRIEYDGSGFAGFQRQGPEAGPTVQGLLEELASGILGERVTVICAGRTDAGVHAIGQVVHIRTESARPLDVFVHALERTAHGRIGVAAAWEAPSWFHARHDASRRVYQYHVLGQPSPAPLLAGRAWHVPDLPDLELLRRESASLLGRRDFRAYQSGGADLRHFFRTVHRLEWERLEAGPARSYLAGIARLPLLVLEIEADAYLPHMVRLMVATVVDVARGRRPPGTAARVLRGRDPRAASAPAPAHGLCLVQVKYLERIGLARAEGAHATEFQKKRSTAPMSTRMDPEQALEAAGEHLGQLMKNASAEEKAILRGFMARVDELAAAEQAKGRYLDRSAILAAVIAVDDRIQSPELIEAARDYLEKDYLFVKHLKATEAATG